MKYKKYFLTTKFNKMKKVIILTFMAFLFSITAYGQTTKTKVQPHHPVKKSAVVKKVEVKTPCYGYASIEEADIANSVLTASHNTFTEKYYHDFASLTDKDFDEDNAVKKEMQRMASAGYMNKTSRETQALNDKNYANAHKNDKPLTQAERQAIIRNIETNMKIGLIYRNGQ